MLNIIWQVLENKNSLLSMHAEDLISHAYATRPSRTCKKIRSLATGCSRYRLAKCALATVALATVMLIRFSVKDPSAIEQEHRSTYSCTAHTVYTFANLTDGSLRDSHKFYLAQQAVCPIHSCTLQDFISWVLS